MLKRWASNGISEIILPSRRSPNRQICWPCIFCLLNPARSDNEIRNGEINEHEICLNTLWSLNISSALRHILHISVSYGSNINMNCKCFDVSLVKVWKWDRVISKVILLSNVKTPCPWPQHVNGQWSAQCNYNCYEAMHKLHYTSVGPLERGPADGMGPLIRLGIKLLFIYSVDKMLPRLIVVGEGNIAECCHWWWLLGWPLYSAGDEYHYTPPSWCPDPSHTHRQCRRFKNANWFSLRQFGASSWVSWLKYKWENWIWRAERGAESVLQYI